MRPDVRMRRAALLVSATLLLQIALEPVARALDLQLQTQFQSFTVKPEGEAADTRSSFQTSYNFGFRRPLAPWSNIQSYLSVNSSDYSDRLSDQSNSNMVFNMTSQQRTYTLTGGLDRNSHRSAISSFGDTSISDGTTSNYNVNFIWAESAMPTLNMQYRRSTSGVTSGENNSTYQTTTLLSGAYYEYSPLRFTWDRQRQTYDFSGTFSSNHSETVRSRAAVNFEQKLLEGLNFSADIGRDKTNTSGARFGSAFGGNSSVFRLTAVPTRSVIMSLDRSYFSSDQSSGLVDSSSKSDSTTLSLRSEILPGLSLSVTDLVTNDRGDLYTSQNKNSSVSLGASLTPDTFATLGWNQSSFASEGQTGSTQKNTYMSFRTPLSIDTDINIDAGWSDSAGGESGYKSKYLGLMARNRSRSDMTMGLGYRWNGINQTGFSAGRQSTQSADFDLAWTPSSTIGLNATANYYVTGGTTISQYLAPTVDLRWEPSSQSNLTLRYNFNRSKQWDPLLAEILGQSNKGISARLSYRLSQKSSFDLTYDYQGASTGGVEYQKALRAFYRTRL